MSKIKWGVIGCGGIADRRTLPGMMDAKNAELIAVMDANYEVAKVVAEKYNAPVLCKDEQEVLAQDIDAVYIATPVFCHKAQVLQALAAGKHVLVEKPVGMTVAEGEEIKAAAEKAGLKVGVGLMMRFHTHHQAIRQILAEGKLGNLVSMRAQFSCWYPDIEGAWRQDKALSGGGALMDLGVHCIDLLQYISGMNAVEVSANCSTQTFKYNVDDSASVLMKMENGANAYVDVNFNIPDEASLGRIEFYGTRGCIIAEGTISQVEGGSVKVVLTEESGYDAMQAHTEAKSYFLPEPSGNMYTKEIESFSDALLNDTDPAITLDQAMSVEKVTAAAYASSESGNRIKL